MGLSVRYLAVMSQPWQVLIGCTATACHFPLMFWFAEFLIRHLIKKQCRNQERALLIPNRKEDVSSALLRVCSKISKDKWISKPFPLTPLNLFCAHYCFVTLFLLPTDPPDGSPSCSVEPALNHTSLRLLCSWSGGFPPASVHWTGDLKQLDQETADQGLLPHPQANTAIVLSSQGLISNNSLFTCRGSHVALKEFTECSTRACENNSNKQFWICTWNVQTSDQCPPLM